MPTMRRTLIAAGAALVLLTSSCGSSEGGGNDPSIDKEEFIASFSERCLEVEADVNAVPEPSNFAELETLAQEVYDLSVEGIADLRDMEAPEDIADEVAEALDLLEGNVDYAEELIEIAKAEDSEALETAADGVEETRDGAQEILAEIGIECDEIPNGSDAEEDLEEFTADFSSRCLEIDEEIDALGEPEETAEDLDRMIGLAQEISLEGIDDLASLDAPVEVADQVDDALALLREQTEQLDKITELAFGDDAAAYDQFVTEMDELEAAAAEILDDIGIDCGLRGETESEELSVTLPDEGEESSSDIESFPAGYPAENIAEFGEDSEWDRAAIGCEDGVMAACDALTTVSAGISAPEDTEMWSYGQTCGDRIFDKLDNYCSQLVFNAADE